MTIFSQIISIFLDNSIPGFVCFVTGISAKAESCLRIPDLQTRRHI